MLGVESGATPEQVKRAYKKLALKYHPDKQSSTDVAAREAAEREMQRVNWAKVRDVGKLAGSAWVGCWRRVSGDGRGVQRAWAPLVL